MVLIERLSSSSRQRLQRPRAGCGGRLEWMEAEGEGGCCGRGGGGGGGGGRERAG